MARASPQGRSAPLAGAVARRGSACRHDLLRPARRGDSRPRTHLLAARCPQRGLAAGRPQGATTRGQQGWLPASKGSRRLRRGNSGGNDSADGARGFEVTLPELFNMLREAESAIKEKPVLYISETKKKRKASKTLKKGKGKERPGKAKVANKYPGKDKGQCFHYGQDGH
ncbi:hypothetical protein GW17_00027335 [Ensete ventricosum]|nr:hypothetical protein GW17_00027335 [Ensete ventricosum]